MAFSTEVDIVPFQWQQRALRRSLGGAQTRSMDRMNRLLAAARDLANETGSAAFTVRDVATTAGLSLKAFYRCFAGKDELLLALLEEDSGLGTGLLAERINRYDDPVERIRAYVEGLFGLLTEPGALGYAGVLIREHRRLAEAHPDELKASIAPLVDLLAVELGGAMQAGRADPGDVHRTAETMFGVLLGGISEVVLGRADPLEIAPWLWAFCWAGVRGEPSSPPRRTRKRGGRS
jgi:AcrR family transcriptional regulator